MIKLFVSKISFSNTKCNIFNLYLWKTIQCCEESWQHSNTKRNSSISNFSRKWTRTTTKHREKDSPTATSSTSAPYLRPRQTTVRTAAVTQSTTAHTSTSRFTAPSTSVAATAITRKCSYPSTVPRTSARPHLQSLTSWWSANRCPVTLSLQSKVSGITGSSILLGYLSVPSLGWSLLF